MKLVTVWEPTTHMTGYHYSPKYPSRITSVTLSATIIPDIRRVQIAIGDQVRGFQLIETERLFHRLPNFIRRLILRFKYL